MKLRIPSSILTAHLASHLALVVVVTGSLAVFVLRAARDGLEAEVGRKLANVARIAADDVPHARLVLIRPGSEQSRMVRRLHEKLRTVQRSAGVAAVDVCGADGRVLLDPTGATPIGSPCARTPDAALRPRLEAGEAVSSGSFRADGTSYVSAFAPVLDPGGALFAVVGVRAGAGEVDVAVAMESRLYVAAGVTLVLGAALSLLLAGWITRPIREVVATADRIGQGDYAARAHGYGTRELAVLAESLNTMAAQVEHRDRKLKAMSGTVAHEIRNPLNTIKLMLTLLDEELADAGGDAHTESVRALHTEIDKLDRVLTDFLTWSRPVAAGDTVGEARGPAEGAVRMAEAAAREAGVRVQLAPPTPLPTVRMDPQRLERCLLNLILNAIQASARDTEVEVHLEALDGHVEYRVLDRGPGIDPADTERLFEPFFTTRTTGTGLGLANARAIAEAHGGRLTLRARPDGGTCAVVRLPGSVG